jgi:ankyrin repeat protein
MSETQIDEDDWFEKERLHRAAASGDMAMIESLLAEGVPPTAFDYISYTPLHYAAVNGHTAAVRRLLRAGADVNAYQEEMIGDTPLEEAARECTLEMATILVEAGADPTIAGWMSLTALDRTLERNDTEGKAVHRLLIETAKRTNPHWRRLAQFL